MERGGKGKERDGRGVGIRREEAGAGMRGD